MRYWVLKTTEGRYGTDYWERFLQKKVIAIGWHEVPVSPDKVSQEELESSLRETYHCTEGSAEYAARTIRRFVNIGEKDIVLLCRGYPANYDGNVHIYGVAQVAGSFYDDRDSDWWRFKHKANIQVIERYVLKSLLENTLKKASMLKTLHEIDVKGFDELLAALRSYYGINIDITEGREGDFKVRQFKIIVEKAPDGYVAYPLGLKGVVIGQGDTYEEAVSDIKSAIQFHIETFGKEVVELEPPVLEAFIAEVGVTV